MADLKKKFGVLLSGCGVYDGSEIHEAVLTLLAVDELGHDTLCFAPNISQHHVVNHINGSEMNESRNVLTEAARIARGAISDLENVSANDFDVLVVPGGFGAAKNLTKWAFEADKGAINGDVKRIIKDTFSRRKPIAAMCMGPTVLAKALEGENLGEQLTVGTTKSSSPYDIAAISERMDALGASSQMVEVDEIIVDSDNKLVTTPCYMMDASISLINRGIRKAMAAALELC